MTPSPSDFPDLKFYFTIPEMILQRYRDSMIKFKMDFLEWIDIPVTINTMRRVLSFKLDRDWLNLGLVRTRTGERKIS